MNEENVEGLDLRFIRESVGVQPSPHRHYSLPRCKENTPFRPFNSCYSAEIWWIWPRGTILASWLTFSDFRGNYRETRVEKMKTMTESLSVGKDFCTYIIISDIDMYP